MRKVGLISAMFFVAMIAGACLLSAQAPTYTLTVVVEGVNEKDGNIGMLVFDSDKGWPDDRKAALRDIAVPAKPSTVNTIEVPNLPAGKYAVAVIHDVNKNHKLDKNFMGVPTEQWGMSTNPSHGLKAPAFNSVTFSLTGNQEIHVKVQ
jgi:uncharacterized protein (DUF2141 family)